jgi:hypothetical protein
MGLTNIPLCWKCETEDETSAHILCECVVLASLRHLHLGYLFLDPVDIKSLGLGATWNLSKRIGLPRTGLRLWGTKGPFLRPRCIRTVRAWTQLLTNQSIKFYNILHFVWYAGKLTTSSSTCVILMKNTLWSLVFCPHNSKHMSCWYRKWGEAEPLVLAHGNFIP